MGRENCWKNHYTFLNVENNAGWRQYAKSVLSQNNYIDSSKLANVVPVKGDWLPEDTVWFNSRVSEKQFVSLIKSIGGDGEPMVELVLVDTTHPSEDKYIDQELIQVQIKI